MHKVLATAVVILSIFSGSAALASAPFVNLVSLEDQVATAADTPVAITMTGAPGVGYRIDGSALTIEAAGDYYISAAAQVGGSAAGTVYLWPRVNGVDLEASNSAQFIPSAESTAVLVSAGVYTFAAGDVIEFVYSATAPGLGLVVLEPTGSPVVPAILFSAYKLGDTAVFAARQLAGMQCVAANFDIAGANVFTGDPLTAVAGPTFAALPEFEAYNVGSQDPSLASFPPGVGLIGRAAISEAGFEIVEDVQALPAELFLRLALAQEFGVRGTVAIEFPQFGAVIEFYTNVARTDWDIPGIQACFQ